MSDAMGPSDDLHELVGVYALDALDDGEAAAFEDHLGTCVACQAELVRLTSVVSDLVPTTAVPQPVDVPDTPVAAAPDELATRRARRSERDAPASRVALATAAAAIAAIVLVAALLLSGLFSTDRVETIAGAPDVEIVELQGGEFGQVDLALSVSEEGVALDGQNLAALPEPELYVLWVFRHNADGPEFVGNITDFRDVDKYWDLDVANADAFAISIEQAPSPSTPSDRVVMVGERSRG